MTEQLQRDGTVSALRSAHATYALLAAVASGSGCSLVLTADQIQCTTTEDCDLGVCFDGLCRAQFESEPCRVDADCGAGEFYCINATCQALPGVWDCNRTELEPLSGPTSFQFESQAWPSLEDVQIAGWKTCEVQDATCETPLDQYDGASGPVVELATYAPEGSLVYLEYQTAEAPTLHLYAPGASPETWHNSPLFYGLAATDADARDATVASNGVEVSSERGQAFLIVRNCAEVAGPLNFKNAGLTVELDPPAPGATVLYVDLGFLRVGDTTGAEGFAMVVGLSAGVYRATAYLEYEGRRFAVAEGTFLTRPGVVTESNLYPRRGSTGASTDDGG